MSTPTSPTSAPTAYLVKVPTYFIPLPITTTDRTTRKPSLQAVLSDCRSWGWDVLESSLNDARYVKALEHYNVAQVSTPTGSGNGNRNGDSVASMPWIPPTGNSVAGVHPGHIAAVQMQYLPENHLLYEAWKAQKKKVEKAAKLDERMRIKAAKAAKECGQSPVPQAQAPGGHAEGWKDFIKDKFARKDSGNMESADPFANFDSELEFQAGPEYVADEEEARIASTPDSVEYDGFLEARAKLARRDSSDSVESVDSLERTIFPKTSLSTIQEESDFELFIKGQAKSTAD